MIRAGSSGAPSGEIQLAVTPKELFLCVQVTDAGAGLAPPPPPDASGQAGLLPRLASGPGARN